MPQLLPEDFADKWIPLLADNVFMNIDGPLLERLIIDIKDSFAASTLTANVPGWVEGTYYPQGYVILHRFVPGPDIFLKANQEGYLDEPTAAVGDANWSPALSPAPDNALYQVGTVEAMRRAYVNWRAGRLYGLIGRVDANGAALPDIYVRALSATQLESEGYLFDEGAIGAVPVRVRYDLATDKAQLVAAPYTDTQARAAQLNRTAPAGTTTVTLAAESPTDYGTASSGTFTVDATACVVGKVVRFALAPGASAPLFTNAPVEQSFKYLGAKYVSGRAFSYSLLVCVDRIEVVLLPD